MVYFEADSLHYYILQNNLWSDIKYHLIYRLDEHYHIASKGNNIEKKRLQRDRQIEYCCNAIQYLLYDNRCIINSGMCLTKVKSDATVIIKRDLLNYAKRILSSIVYFDNGGWKEPLDINDICSESEKKMNISHQKKVNTTRRFEKEAKNIDYDEIRAITQDEDVFRNIDVTSALQEIFQNFTNKLANLNSMKQEHYRMIETAQKAKNSHRLNVRARHFKPWKLYASAPVYSDIITPMMYDESDTSSFNRQFIIPEDIGRIITEYVGYEFLDKTKEYLILEKKSKSDNIRSSLSTWTMKELKKYTKIAPYNCIHLNPHKNLLLTSVTGLNKSKLIDTIVTGFPDKEQYYPFYRDVMILTPVIKELRKSRRKALREANK